MASGESASQRAAAARATAERYRVRADRADRAAGDWARGAQGETALAKVMAPLAGDGCYHLDDRRFPGSSANLDHVLVGPAGVFVIDAKSWTGDIKVEGKSLRQDGRRRDTHVERLRLQATELAGVLEELMGARRPPVYPVMCFVGGTGIAALAPLDRVHLLNSGDLVGFIRGFPRRFDQASVDQVMRGLLDRLPARTAPAASGRTAEATKPPEELVVFLQPWVKHGQRRLYVKADDGSDVGFLNLVTGEVHASAEAWKPVLAQLLPHYVMEGAGTIRAEQLSGAARGVFRRFLDAMIGRAERAPQRPLLAAYHWKNYGKDRLYLHRFDPTGEKQELGWFDLESGGARSRDPKARPILGYCGERFRDFVAH